MNADKYALLDLEKLFKLVDSPFRDLDAQSAVNTLLRKGVIVLGPTRPQAPQPVLDLDG